MMKGQIRYSPKSRSRRKQKEIDGQYAWIFTKKILPVAFLGLWLLAMGFLWWIAFTPARWKCETITYARMSQVEVNFGRGKPSIIDVIIDAEGRHFGLSDEERAAVSGKLRDGEQCEIVYSPNPIGMGPEHVEGLSTQEDGELISAEASRFTVYEDRKAMWWMVGIPVLVCGVVEVLIEIFGCKKERAKIARLKAEQAKLTAREERQRAYQESKRAGV